MILQKNKKFWKAIILNLVMSVIHNGAFSTAVSAGSGSKWLNFTDFFFQNYQGVIQINCSKCKVLLGDMTSALKFKSSEYM